MESITAPQSGVNGAQVPMTDNYDNSRPDVASHGTDHLESPLWWQSPKKRYIATPNNEMEYLIPIIGRTAYNILQALRSHYSQTGQRELSMKTIARKAGCAESTARDNMLFLYQGNLVQKQGNIIKHARKKGNTIQWDCNRYVLPHQSRWTLDKVDRKSKKEPTIDAAKLEASYAPKEVKSVHPTPKECPQAGRESPNNNSSSQLPSNNNTGASPDVEFANAPDLEILADGLRSLGVKGKMPLELAREFPDVTRMRIGWWKRRPKFHQSRRSPAGAVIASIRRPDSCPVDSQPDETVVPSLATADCEIWQPTLPPMAPKTRNSGPETPAKHGIPHFNDFDTATQRRIDQAARERLDGVGILYPTPTELDQARKNILSTRSAEFLRE